MSSQPHQYRVVVDGLYPRYYHHLEDAHRWAGIHYPNATIWTRTTHPNGATGPWIELP